MAALVNHLIERRENLAKATIVVARLKTEIEVVIARLKVRMAPVGGGRWFGVAEVVKREMLAAVIVVGQRGVEAKKIGHEAYSVCRRHLEAPLAVLDVRLVTKRVERGAIGEAPLL